IVERRQVQQPQLTVVGSELIKVSVRPRRDTYGTDEHEPPIAKRVLSGTEINCVWRSVGAGPGHHDTALVDVDGTVPAREDAVRVDKKGTVLVDVESDCASKPRQVYHATQVGIIAAVAAEDERVDIGASDADRCVASA